MNLVKVSRHSVVVGICALWEKAEKKKNDYSYGLFTSNNFSFLFLFGSAELRFQITLN